MTVHNAIKKAIGAIPYLELKDKFNCNSAELINLAAIELFKHGDPNSEHYKVVRAAYREFHETGVFPEKVKID